MRTPSPSSRASTAKLSESVLIMLARRIVSRGRRGNPSRNPGRRLGLGIMWKALAAAALLISMSGAAPARRAHHSVSYANPVLDADFPDPMILRAPDGAYYGYATQTKRVGHWLNIQLARSI